MTNGLNNAPLAAYQAAADAIARSEKIVCVTHFKPDGDAIGSLLGMTLHLRAQGKIVTAAVDDGVPPYLRYVPGSETVQAKLKSGDFDLAIALDAADEERGGAALAYAKAHAPLIINIDHHPTNTRFGDIHLIEPDAVSTTEVLVRWYTALDWTYDTATATALLTGLVTDTLGFRTNNVMPSTMATVQALMERGAPLYTIIAKTLGSHGFLTVELWKYGLQTVQLQQGVISAEISKDVLKQLRVEKLGDVGGLVGFLNQTEEAKAAVVFREQADGRVEISFRCKPGYNVATVAVSLGGGGHTLAAGATVPGPLADVKARVLPLLAEAVKTAVIP